MLTCLRVHVKQAGLVSGDDAVGDPTEAARVSVSGDDVEDLSAGLSVAADARRVFLWVEHRSVVVQVLHLNVHVGLSAQTPLEGWRNVSGREERPMKGFPSTYGIFSSDQDVVNRLARVSIDVLREAQLSALGVDVEERVSVATVKAVRERVEQRAKLRTVRIRGDNLKRRKKGKKQKRIGVLQIV